MSRSDYSKAPVISQTCPQCGAEMRLKRKEPAPGSATLERLFFECACGHTAGRMQAKTAQAG
jgi:transposase